LSTTSGLNPPQKQAVTHGGSPLLVLAGAGSGKTRVITCRIAWLIHDRAVSPADIHAVTFTNKAAREMAERVKGMLENPKSDRGPGISTFHALGMKILRSEANLAGLRPGFSILDPRDIQGVVAEILRSGPGGDADMAERVARRISTLKNQGIDPGQAPVEQGDPLSRVVAPVYTDYQRYLRACNAVDLDDLLLLPVTLLRQNPERLRHWQLCIRFLLVDEYQDTNEAQYQLIRLLTGDGRGLTVVGDDDQSIYAWRGARPENLARLAKDFPGLTLIKLEQNYRSSGRILGAANHLIRHNPRAFEKTLWSALGHGDPIRVVVADSEQDEAAKVVSAIMRRQFKSRCNHGDFAVLYRGNHQSRDLEVALREMRIPYRVSGGSSFFDRGEVRDVMAYLRLLANPSDDSALLRIINTPRRGVGTTSLEQLAALARRNGASLFATLGDESLRAVLKPRQAAVLGELSTRLEQFHQQAQNDPMQAAEDLLSYIDYRRWLRQNNDPAVADRRWDNVQLLMGWLESATRATTPGEDRSLAELLSDLMINELAEQDSDDQDRNRVSLMTLHAAKGLEFPHVFIVGVEEDSLPHRVSVDNDEIDEERRLFYVGITRAKQTLQLSHARRRKRFGDWVDCDPSRFLAELPAEDLEWESGSADDNQQSVETGRAHLASIRALRARRGGS
jgi:ATP-dependent DNA helicase Rep